MNPLETARSTVSLSRSYEHYFGPRKPVHTLEPVRGTPLWWVLRDGVKHRDFTSLAAARGWLEHVERKTP
jgi:hypothetical protein